MIDSLNTEAEKKASEAEELPAFSGIKLLHIKRGLAELLSLIGRDGIFDEYTLHDITHIDEMLKILEWLIPNETKEIMSPADWLLSVLAIYFHDLGMLVTRQEYEDRENSGYPEYREKELFGGEKGADYRAKVEQLSPEKAERFLYQEFVRGQHAERIRYWVVGHAPDYLGITTKVMTEVNNLLNELDPQFRRDLALVCESHHLTDLKEFTKYKTSQPYGNSDQETANIHYAAILLRTSDLLHITRDRTPSISFRLINPSDPLSQTEWAKQKAVKRVRAKIGLDKEGRPDDNAPRDTIEIFANFTEENGFFGLTSYIKYAEDQIRQSFEWIQLSRSIQGSKHQFPWRYIDDTNIETEGFLKNAFEFTIDQYKILDLLTGHTLYNDTSVVLRELVQNALDAIRIQNIIDLKIGNPVISGNIKISWDSKQRVLSVEDNGTGMTQSIIEKHLLRVGASRYQDSEFRRDYPEFSAISRFGIGLLSTFMIADNVEIITCHPEEQQSRQISLRSVHGKYLIRLLDKKTDDAVGNLKPHGTVVKLTVRHSAEIGDIIDIAKRWIVVPECEIAISVDDTDLVKLGFSSPKEALIDYLTNQGILVDNKSIKIDQKEMNGITLAYALRWNNFFQEWSFLDTTILPEKSKSNMLLGTCIEGIRVEFNSPGFNKPHIIAIANAKGNTAPKTNVARIEFEITPERNAMLKAIYSIYCEHVKYEINKLYEERHFSLTWATRESRYLLASLIYTGIIDIRAYKEQGVEPIEYDILFEIVSNLPILLAEYGSERKPISPATFNREKYFWTIDCELFRSAEMLIREVESPASLLSLVNGLRANNVQLPSDPILCGFDTRNDIETAVFEGKEVDIITIYPEQRRIDLRWTEKTDPPRWLQIDSKIIKGFMSLRRSPRYEMERVANLRIGNCPSEIIGATDEIAVNSFNNIYIYFIILRLEIIFYLFIIIV